jgi:hypothetical protein
MGKCPDVVVRAYDLGGYGDIAGAMRVASHCDKIGLRTRVLPKSESALSKLLTLGPDTKFDTESNAYRGAIQVDVAGHYGDYRNNTNNEVPHHYTEDMDNPSDRSTIVPCYMKTGLRPHSSVLFSGNVFGPMFYRPFREWELPQSGERDARKLCYQAISKNAKNWRELGGVIPRISRMGFVHLSPQIQNRSREVAEHPYFEAVHGAAISSNSSYGLGLFVSNNIEQDLVSAFHFYSANKWNIIRSSGEIEAFDSAKPTIVFLGPQHQRLTTSLFLSSDIPNLVTGDLSLSDALYALIAMGGHGFFYETPAWKNPTQKEIVRLLKSKDLGMARMYETGSGSSQDIEGLDKVVEMLSSEVKMQEYSEKMRNAVRAEVRRRFGDVVVEGNLKDGFYIPAGVPYLLQDATAAVVNSLIERPDFLMEAEKRRMEIAAYRNESSSCIPSSNCSTSSLTTFNISPISMLKHDLKIANDIEKILENTIKYKNPDVPEKILEKIEEYKNPHIPKEMFDDELLPKYFGPPMQTGFAIDPDKKDVVEYGGINLGAIGKWLKYMQLVNK